MKTTCTQNSQWGTSAKMPPIFGWLKYKREESTVNRETRVGFTLVTLKSIKPHGLWSILGIVWKQQKLFDKKNKSPGSRIYVPP